MAARLRLGAGSGARPMIERVANAVCVVGLIGTVVALAYAWFAL